MPSACNTAFTCFLTINTLAWTKMQSQTLTAAQGFWLSGSTAAQGLWLSGSTATQGLWANAVEPSLQVIDAQWLALGPANQKFIIYAAWGLFLGVAMRALINAFDWAFPVKMATAAPNQDFQMTTVKPLFPPSPALRRSSRPTVAPERFAPPTHVKAAATKRSAPKPKQQVKGNPVKPKGLNSMYLYHEVTTTNGVDTRKGYYHKSSGYIQDTTTKAWTTLSTFGVNHFKDLVAAGLIAPKSYRCSINALPSSGGLYALNRGNKKRLSEFC
jgi:hypothetical protein